MIELGLFALTIIVIMAMLADVATSGQSDTLDVIAGASLILWMVGITLYVVWPALIG